MVANLGMALADSGSTVVVIDADPRTGGLTRLVDIRKELYVGMLVDRASQRVTLMASSEGGMEIEEVAAHTRATIDALEVVDQLRRENGLTVVSAMHDLTLAG